MHTALVDGDIGVHYTTNKLAVLIVSSGQLNPESWVQPFYATPPGVDALRGFLLGSGVGTGALGNDTAFVFDVRCLEIVPGGVDANGANRLKEALPLNALVARVKDAGNPGDIGVAIQVVRTYFGVP